MHHKIYISIIVILVSVFSWISYTTFASSSEQKTQSDTLKMIMASERTVRLEDGREWKACNVHVNDKETKRLIAAHRFVLSIDGTCPALPSDYYISKSDYIKELQTNEGFGIFDEDSIYPGVIKGQKLNFQTVTNSSISLAN